MMPRLLAWSGPLGRGLLLMTVLLALVGLAWLGHDTDKRWYWGSSSTATLGEASRKLTQQLEDTVAITVALPKGHNLRHHAQRLINAYQRHHAEFELTFVDPKADAEQARELGLVRTGQALVDYQGRTEIVGSPTEARVSAALERLLRRGDQFIAFLTGNGARDLLGQGNYELGAFGKALERKGYRLQPLDLQAAGAVPTNARVVVIAAPEEPLDFRKQTALRKYLRDGGAVLWLAEPGGPGPAPVLPVRVGEETVTDKRSRRRLDVDDDWFILLKPPFDHPGAENVTNPIVLMGAASLSPEPGDDWQRTPLLPKPKQTKGGQGSALGLSLTQGQTGARAAVVGDVDAWTNTYLGNGDNLRLGLQIMDWLAGTEDFIGTYVEPASDQRLAITGMKGLTAMGSLIGLIPLILTLGAFMQWRRLRRD